MPDPTDEGDGAGEADGVDGADTVEAVGDDARETDHLPEAVAADAERLTRLARGAVDDAEAAAYRRERDALLEDHGFTARVREEAAGDDALVCYPAEWVEDGVVQVERIDDVDRGVERPLEGPGDGDWDAVAARNDAVVDRVAEQYGEPHVETARALADFASNHYAKPIAELTPEEVREFEEAYFPRNAWPSEEQLATVEDTIEIVFEELEAAPGDPP